MPTPSRMGEPKSQNFDFLSRLCCPIDRRTLLAGENEVYCEKGHHFHVIKGVPILLHPDVQPSMDIAPLQRMALENLADRGFFDAHVAHMASHTVDPFVQRSVGATNGNMYLKVRGRLDNYPLPQIPLPEGQGKTFLDVGCNWGRWSISASRLGYQVFGLDPNPEAVFAALRVTSQLGINARFVVGDVRYVPFKPKSFDVTYSYSVLQHFAPEDLRSAVREIKSVLAPGGTVLVQMANLWGARNLWQLAKRGFRPGRHFNVRYWRLSHLKEVWERGVGPVDFSVDGFFSLNPQHEEAAHLPKRFQYVVKVSDWLKGKAQRLPFLLKFADSVFVSAKLREPG